ncbi:late secretory pathway protein AVL9 homolog [Centruroides sculpturatus]|uniref:late secretory pathway protein AVL9 homolog n=1 Tax=Centruroides sculpturatus TaxID=218467 RepID=UPI000C6EEBD5|nr:late secretory pathway protein AVL9 homolog [Centruroides sculpturatus]
MRLNSQTSSFFKLIESPESCGVNGSWHKFALAIRCYSKLLNKSSDITRGSVQKSVCVLSVLPLYGLIQAKLELITHAYFDERDFSKVSLLEETYKNLNASLSREMLSGTQAFLGLSVRDVVLNFKHKAVLLFKLFLLERKVLFSKSPVKDLCAVILSICSLFPGMIEKGLIEAAANITNKHYSSELRMSNEHDYLEVHIMENNNDNELGNISSNLIEAENSEMVRIDNNQQVNENYGNLIVESVQNTYQSKESSTNTKINSELEKKNCNLSVSEITFEEEDKLLDEIDEVLSDCSKEENEVDNCSKNREKKESDKVPELSGIQNHNDLKMKDFKEMHENESFDKLSDNTLMIETDDCGFPLSIFTKGSLCHPYLSLPFLDLLSDVNTRSFVVGATNVLFKQKKYLFDVIVEISCYG